jgi:hypothetical protein
MSSLPVTVKLIGADDDVAAERAKITVGGVVSGGVVVVVVDGATVVVVVDGATVVVVVDGATVVVVDGATTIGSANLYSAPKIHPLSMLFLNVDVLLWTQTETTCGCFALLCVAVSTDCDVTPMSPMSERTRHPTPNPTREVGREPEHTQ